MEFCSFPESSAQAAPSECPFYRNEVNRHACLVGNTDNFPGQVGLI